MKIIYLGRYNPSEILTGPEKVAKRIYCEVKKIYQVKFIEYFFDGSNYTLFRKIFGFVKIKYNNNNIIYRMGLLKLFSFLIKEKPDIIHLITFERFSLVAFLYKMLFDVKILYNVHGIIQYENINFKNINSFLNFKDYITERIIYKYSDELLFLSKSSVKIAGSFYSLDNNNIKYIINGVDRIFYETYSDRKRHHKNTVDIVFVGNYNRPEKGYIFLRTIFGKIDFNCNFHIVNNSIRAEEKINQFVTLFYYKKMSTTEYSSFLKNKDIFISASNYEPFSISAAEAMIAGLSLILTKETGLSEYLDQNLNVYIISFGDKEELLNTLTKLNSLEKFSQNYFQNFSQFSWEEIIKKYISIYGNVLKKGKIKIN